MQVIMVSEFGGPEVLELGEAEIPRPHSGEVLVRVIAAGVGPWDASFRRGGWAGYSWHDAAQAHREVERGHTQGKIALIVDDDLAASLGV